MSDRGGRLGIALIGAGRIGSTWAEAIARSTSTDLLAVVDVRLDQAVELTSRHGGAPLVDYHELFELERLEAVVVATPPASHETQCRSLLEHGLAVLCEKPLTLSTSSARRLLRTSRTCGRPLMLASKFRYTRDVRAARRLIESGKLGAPRSLINRFYAPVDMSSRWNSDPAVSGGGVLIDNGAHSFDIVRYLLGSLDTVEVHEGERKQGLEVEETVRILATTPSGASARIELSWSHSSDDPNFIVIQCEGGRIEVGWQRTRYSSCDTEDWIPLGNGYDKLAAFGCQLDEFARLTRNSRTPVTIHPEDALAAVSAIEAGYRSLRSKSRQRLDADDKPLVGLASSLAPPREIDVGASRLAAIATD